MLSRDGGGELAGDEEAGGPDASGSSENFLQSAARVTVGVAQREQVDGRDRAQHRYWHAQVAHGPRGSLSRQSERLGHLID